MKKPKRTSLRRYNLVIPEAVWAKLRMHSAEHGGRLNDLIVEACETVYGVATEQEIDAIVFNKTTPTVSPTPSVKHHAPIKSSPIDFSFTSIVYSGPEIQTYQPSSPAIQKESLSTAASLFKKAFGIKN